MNFFYAVTGSTDKLYKMNMLAERVDDPILKYNSSLLTANVEQRVRVLMEANQLTLAYLTARSHNLTDLVEVIEQEMQDNDSIDAMQVMDETSEYCKRGKALIPMQPCQQDQLT